MKKEDKAHFNCMVEIEELSLLKYGLELHKKGATGFEEFDLEKHKKIMEHLRRLKVVSDYIE